MWKIDNHEDNKEKLDNFRDMLIKPLFKEVINYKKKKNYNRFNTLLDYINANTTMDQSKKQLLRTVLQRSKNKKKVFEHYEDLCKNSLSYIKKQYRFFLIQNKKLDNRKYNIKEYVINESLKIIFKDFYYSKFFTDDVIWEGVNPSYKGYTRQVFHMHFSEKNDLLICPYCDSDTLNNIGGREIEHFLPKGKYPFLAMHPYNLISSCHSCNKHEGKKTNYYLPMISPYNDQIGEKLRFKINHSLKIVEIEKHKVNEIDNYIKLLNLYERYKNRNIYNSLERRASGIFKHKLKNENAGNAVSDIVFDEYLNQRYEPLTFALKNIYENMSQYILYKNNIKP